MAKGGSETGREDAVMPGEALVNTGAPMLGTDWADWLLVEDGGPPVASRRSEQRVLEIQTKLHRWAVTDSGRRFDDLFNFVADPAFLAVAWTRVRENKGARSAGVDRRTARSIEASAHGVDGLLADLRESLKSRTFRPLPVRRRKIPKANGKLRSLGIPTVVDRVVQASLKLVLEPILEADFHPVSYGFRPRRRAQDAIEEIRFYASRGYEWAFEGDIAACFDEIDHTALMQRLRRRITDKRVLALVKAFLKAGLLDEDGVNRDTLTGTPQGGILSPLLANLALSTLDEHFMDKWQAHRTGTDRIRHRARGAATYRLIRYADDFVIVVNGSHGHAEALWEEVETVLATIGLRLAVDKTRTVHIDEGFDFLGFHIQRHRQKGSDRRLIYTYPSQKSVASIRRKVKEVTVNKTTNMSAARLFTRLAQITRGWALYFRHGSSNAAYQDLQHYQWWRVWQWLRHKHPHRSAKWIIQRYYPDHGWLPAHDGVRLWRPATMTIVRYRYRGTKIPTPWTQQPEHA
jgi:RNA-directed DNA polymerase